MPAETPADRALRAMADAASQARERAPEDGDDPGIPVAATVLLLRDGADGPEVLMIERPDRGSFAGAWVFPGGKLEPDDAGDGEHERARSAGARETREETGLEIDPAAFVAVSRWDPPPGLPLRIRTWFFAAPAPGGDLVLSPDEAVAADWVRPGDMLERHGRGEVTLYPPTWVTLDGLAGQARASALLDALRLRGVEHFETAVRRQGDTTLFLWQGDAAYASDAEPEASGARHRLVVGALPWSYTRTA